MAGTENSLTLFILLTISHVSLLLNLVIAVNPSGFSMKIIHRDSVESPLYPGDHLTEDERLQRLVQQSKDRARYIGLQISSFNETTNSINPDIARLPLAYEVGSFYVALVGIGTFSNLPQPFKNYYLMVDTASELVWTQCEGGVSYFHQDEPLYPATSSSTYEPLRCNIQRGERHPLCVPLPERCVNEICTYQAQYASSSSSIGVLAKEKLTVNSDNDGLQPFDMIIGCGFNQRNFGPLIGSGYRSGNPDVIAGILGLNAGPRSFLSQLGPAGGNKFAHCLMPYTNGTAPSTYLRFGEDARIGGGGQQVYTTPLVSYDNNPYYYLRLEDISVGENRLGFHPRDFEFQTNNRRGGCLIDSGSPITTMYGPHFDRVAQEVVEYFLVHEGIQLVPAARRSYLSLCFRKPSNPDFKYPTMTFHFQGGANFLLDEPDTIFSITANDFCLGILRVPIVGPFDVVFGAMQQARKRIVHDVGEGRLSFAKEECQLGS